MEVSEKRLAANRANAVKSTGPRSPEGKARSSRNAVKHPFTGSSFAVVRLEELDEIDRLKQDLIDTYQPVNSQELFALERVALAQQAMLRTYRFEAGFFTNCLNEAFLDRMDRYRPLAPEVVRDVQTTAEQNRNYALAWGFDRLWNRSQSFLPFLRYQAQTERLYRRALDEFHRLKALRGEMQNEPISDVELEQYQAVSTLETNPPAPPEPMYPPKPVEDTSPLTPEDWARMDRMLEEGKHRTNPPEPEPAQPLTDPEMNPNPEPS